MEAGRQHPIASYKHIRRVNTREGKELSRLKNDIGRKNAYK